MTGIFLAANAWLDVVAVLLLASPFIFVVWLLISIHRRNKRRKDRERDSFVAASKIRSNFASSRHFDYLPTPPRSRSVERRLEFPRYTTPVVETRSAPPDDSLGLLGTALIVESIVESSPSYDPPSYDSSSSDSSSSYDSGSSSDSGGGDFGGGGASDSW